MDLPEDLQLLVRRGGYRARPIEELIAQFANGDRVAVEGRDWASLDARERAEVLGRYRLAYASDAPVNWAPGLGTVLANEEVTSEGRSERGNFPVFKAKLRQWNMRITAYADRLLDDLDGLDWPEAIKLQQRNWIGRSEGARVDFPFDGEHTGKAVTVFTTRQDTLFGATYMVLAPEHELVDEIVPAAWPDGTRESWTGGHATPAEAVEKYRASPPASPTWSGRPMPRRRPASSPAPTRSTRSAASTSRSSSPTTS
ncbi:hypothetical protein ACFQVA_11480 [Actinomadura keratinilytica]